MEFSESDPVLSEEQILQTRESDLTVTGSEELSRSHRETSILEEQIDEDLVLGTREKAEEQEKSEQQK